MDEKWRNSKTYIPDLALITSIDGGQNKTPYETTILKSKIVKVCIIMGK